MLTLAYMSTQLEQYRAGSSSHSSCTPAQPAPARMGIACIVSQSVQITLAPAATTKAQVKGPKPGTSSDCTPPISIQHPATSKASHHSEEHMAESCRALSVVSAGEAEIGGKRCQRRVQRRVQRDGFRPMPGRFEVSSCRTVGAGLDLEFAEPGAVTRAQHGHSTALIQQTST